MKLSKTGIVLLSSLVLSGLVMVTLDNPTVKANVTPTVVTTTNDSNDTTGTDPQIDQQGIAPVANEDNNTLQQVANNNNVDLSTLESLNGNVDPNQPLPDGTPIYLPQNQIASANSLDAEDATSAKSGLSEAQWEEFYESYSKANRDAKIWIAKHESGFSYSARNGQYIGRFQLTSSYLNGDYSVENQERTADKYVSNRYGSWTAAKAHWEAYGWY